jgi:hypothetical protein
VTLVIPVTVQPFAGAGLPPSLARFAHDGGYVPRGGQCPGSLTPIGRIVAPLPGDIVVLTPTGVTVKSLAPIALTRARDRPEGQRTSSAHSESLRNRARLCLAPRPVGSAA